MFSIAPVESEGGRQTDFFPHYACVQFIPMGHILKGK